MSAATGRRKRSSSHEEEHENEERWLVSFADMMTLLFCLFMVLFAISSVNTSKFKELSKSLQEAFSGKVLPGGKAVMSSGSDSSAREAPTVTDPSIVPMEASSRSNSPEAAEEQRELEALKQRVDRAAGELGMRGQISSKVEDKGLVVRLRTDGTFFAPGSADLQPGSGAVIGRLGRLVQGEADHPLVVEGHTDSTPIHTATFPSNWELSGDRASSVMRALVDGGMSVNRNRSVQGYADTRPTASNKTPEGRAANRRVEIVLNRLHQRTTP